MELWVTSKGEKKGPLKEWDIRDLIASGHVTETDLVWHAGLEQWTPLKEFSTFSSLFKPSSDIIEEDTVTLSGDAITNPQDAPETIENSQSTPKFWVRRGFAKVFDLFLYYSLFFICLNTAGIHFGLLEEHEWMRFIMLTPFLFIEAFLIQCSGLSAGKWLLGLKIKRWEGASPISFGTALLRSLASWFFGMALGFPPYFLLSMLITYLNTRARPYTSWDIIGKTRVIHTAKVSFLRMTLYTTSLFFLLFGTTAFIQSHPPTARIYRTFVEQNYKELLQQYPQLKDALPPSASE